MSLPLAVLKVWMEGGSYDSNGQHFEFDALGMNTITSEQIIYVDPISSSDLPQMSLEELNYDILVIGFSDLNDGINSITNDSAIKFCLAKMLLVAFMGTTSAMAQLLTSSAFCLEQTHAAPHLKMVIRGLLKRTGCIGLNNSL